MANIKLDMKSTDVQLLSESTGRSVKYIVKECNFKDSSERFYSMAGRLLLLLTKRPSDN